ncbi:unnamed protein product [Caenorhabditis auriculariae]|uniref:ZP domain-containing protein n=1 Tax=Caenorhabditis auriculariae TaxID=2777116 RepID=A0A8S1HNI9_9PELO|nr:unnamed protein product [Caenorhabditis auriculariae]
MTSELFLFLLLLMSQTTSAGDVTLPNEVVGEPIVNCAADAIYVKLRTNATFTGHVDVKYTPNRLCFQSLVTNNQIELLIPHEECSVARRRSLHPSGVIIEASVSVSFHAEFTTADDRVFNLQCFHQKKSNGSSALVVGSPKLPPQDANEPSCSYEVLDSSGGLATRVALGETVEHLWSCSNVYESCLWIQSCRLVAGSSQHDVIDEKGCSLHEDLMPQLTYFNRTSVGVNVSVFGVSHSPLVYFSCQIRLNPALPTGECPVPDCTAKTQAHRRHRSVSAASLPVLDVRSQNIEISQILEKRKNEPKVQEISSCAEPAQEVQLAEQKKEMEISEMCFDMFTVTVGVALAVLMSVVLIAMLAAFVFRRKNYEIASNT